VNKNQWWQVPVPVPMKLMVWFDATTYIKLLLGETLEVNQEDDNDHDEYAIIRRGYIVWVYTDSAGYLLFTHLIVLLKIKKMCNMH